MVYVLKLDQPLGNEKHYAQFYVGWSKNEYTLAKRIEHHMQGRGSKFTQAAIAKGYNVEVVLTMEGGKDVERKIKNQHNTKRFVERELKRRESTLCTQ